MRNPVVVVQGLARLDLVKGIKESWKGFPIIFSTWEDVPETIFNSDDTVLYNKYPSGNQPGNWPLQRLSTLNGLLKAKELGYSRAIKWRTDFQTNNAYGLLDLFQEDSLNFYAYMDHHSGYFTDFFIEGSLDDLISIFSTQETGGFPEEILTNQIKKLGLDKKSYFICKKLTPEVDIYWEKRDYWLHINNVRSEYREQIF
jgi:hypothetical protein